MRLLKELEDKKGEVKDPTAYVTSALRKAGRGAMPTRAPAGQLNGQAEDQKLRKRIGWLNKQGGFENAINYDKILEAAQGLEYSTVMAVLENVEEKKGEVKDPTAWVCAGLRKKDRQALTHYEEPSDQKLRKRIGWLNNEGGFANGLNYNKVAEASAGVSQPDVMRILKELEDKKDQVKDPTAYVTAAMRKLGGGAGPGGSAGMWVWTGNAPPTTFAAPLQDAFNAGRSRMSPYAAPKGYADPGIAQGDQKLRKRIGWLNNEGGFNNTLIYDKIIEAAAGIEYSAVLQVLKQVEEKQGEVRDPNSWVCAALRKEGGGGSFQAGAYPAAMDVDSDVGDAKLRKRVGWLNKQGGFENSINYTKVAEAAEGVSTQEVMEVLKDLESKREEVKDPTAYATAAIRRGRTGSRGKGAGKGDSNVKKMPWMKAGAIGVKKSVAKKKVA